VAEPVAGLVPQRQFRDCLDGRRYGFLISRAIDRAAAL
jgi:hypothetical protein